MQTCVVLNHKFPHPIPGIYDYLLLPSLHNPDVRLEEYPWHDVVRKDPVQGEPPLTGKKMPVHIYLYASFSALFANDIHIPAWHPCSRVNPFAEPVDKNGQCFLILRQPILHPYSSGLETY
jgi:hypothetical protein